MAHRRFVSAVGSGLLVLLAAGTAHAAGPYAYLTHFYSAAVSVVDTNSGSVTVLPVGILPSGVAATPTRVYVTNFADNSVSVIDTATNTVVDTILNVGSDPFGIAAEPSGERVWIGSQGNRKLSVIHTATNAVESVDLPAMPVGLAVHPTGTAVLVTMADGNLVMLSTSSPSLHSTLAHVNGGLAVSSVGGVAISPGGNRAWVAFQSVSGGGQVAVVDLDVNQWTLTVAGAVPVGAWPLGVAVDPQGSRVYVGGADRSISVVDAASSIPLHTLSNVGWGPAGLSVHPTAAELWVTDEGDTQVVVVDTMTHAMKAIRLADTTTSFGVFIAAPADPAPPAAPGCDDGLQAAVEQALAKVEEAIRRSLDGSFAVPGDTASRVGHLGRGMKGLNRGHLTGVYHNLLHAPSGETDPPLCDEALVAAVAAMLSTVEGALQGIDRSFTLRGNGMVARLKNVADAVASLDRGRLQGVYSNLR